jgi:signal transduction histidine kinase
MTGFRFRLLWPVGLITVCLVSLCAFTALSLFHQQATMTGLLRENVSSRRAAADFRGCLNVLVELENRHIESVADLHDQALAHRAAIRGFADQPAEREFAARLDAGFAEYLRLWQSLPPLTDPGHTAAVTAATRSLEANVLVPCRELEEYNDSRIEDSTRRHEHVLRQLAWGMAGVGGLGGVAGIVLGFGVARGLSRSIRRLQVQVRQAAGKLGPNLPEIVLTRDGDFGGLEEQIEALTTRIETVVQELQQRGNEVLRAEQLAAVGQLAAGVAHEIRNPLTSIKLLVQAGLEDGGQPGLAIEDLRVIEDEVRRMERSLRTFLDFARPPKLERRPIDVTEVVRAVAGLVRGRADKQRVELRVAAPADPVSLTADRDQLPQVVVNLALNALDAMPAGGVMTLAVRRRTDRRVEVEVADTGPGVGKDILPRLFQPFVSGKDTGLGLGLAVSKRIVADHEGTITAANRPGSGASFFVVLPADHQPDR